MKILFIATWAIVAIAAPGSVSDKEDDDISSVRTYDPTPVATPRVIDVNRDLLFGVAISSGYGGAYGYIPIEGVAKTNVLPSSGIGHGYDEAYASLNVINENRSLQPDFGVSSGYGGFYGYFPTSTTSFNNVNVQTVSKKPQVLNMRKMGSKSPVMLSRSSGYTGYGNGISSYSGYSRYPENAGYGFAYASGWL